jgi:hypothetical protein
VKYQFHARTLPERLGPGKGAFMFQKSCKTILCTLQRFDGLYKNVKGENSRGAMQNAELANEGIDGDEDT